MGLDVVQEQEERLVRIVLLAEPPGELRSAWPGDHDRSSKSHSRKSGIQRLNPGELRVRSKGFDERPTV